MPSLPPRLWAELFFDSAWNPITADVRQTSAVTVTRGLTSESSSQAQPTASELVLDSRTHLYAPRNPSSELYGKIGRNTPLRWGYRAGSPWAAVDGTDGNELTTPHSAGFDVTDVDLRLDLALETWANGQNLAARYVASGNNRSWAVELAGTGQVTFLWSPDGTLASRISQFSTIPVVAYNGQRLALRITLDVDNGASGYELRFYTGRTVDDAEHEWSLLGDPIVGGATTAVYDATAGLELGDIADLAEDSMSGKLHAFKLFSGIGVAGTLVASMLASDAGVGAASFSSGGLTWTVAGGAEMTNKHTRMSGEVPEWPISRDVSGNDTTVAVAPTGVTRRMDAGNKPQDSALLRFIKANDPIECWPLTDGADVTAGKSLNGSPDMRLVLDTGTATPEWGQGSLAEWIEPVVLLPASTDGTLKGSTARASGAATGWSVDFFYNGKQDFDFTIADYGDLSDADPRIGWSFALDQSADQITLTTVSAGETSTSSALQSTITSAGVFDGAVHHIRLTTSVSGANANFEIFVDGVSEDSGTATGYASEEVLFVRPGWFYASTTSDIPSIGYVTYWGSSGVPSAADMYDAATGFQGEKAGARITRLATEAGYTATVAGESVYQRPMGIQGRKKLLELLNEASQTNFGHLLDARDRAEVIHRGSSTLWNQHPALTLDFSDGLISPPFKPRDDDLLTENDVSVQREFGGVPSRQILESGALSVQDPPNGVGRYDNEYTYSLSEDDDAAQTAFLRLHLGTFDGVRYSRITLDLANERVHQMIDDILRVDVGDLIRLTNLPEDHGADDVDVIVQGYSEEAGPTAWRITFNCVPGEPWRALTVDTEGLDRVDTAGCELAEDLDGAETSVDVTTTATYRWVDSATYASDFPFDILVGGEVMRVTACTGTTTSQTFTVTRSVNGVVKTHSTGADVRLFKPVYIPL